MPFPSKDAIYKFVKYQLDPFRETVCTVCKHDNPSGADEEPCKTCDKTSARGSFELDWSKLA